MEKLKLTEKSYLDVIQMLSELAKNYSVTVRLFHVSVESNFIELFEKNEQSLYKTKQELEVLGDAHFKTHFDFDYLEGELDLQFERNDGKNRLKYFGKQYPKNRQFIPFGTDLFISDDKKYAMSIYTRKDAVLTDVAIFFTRTVAEYLSYAKHKRNHFAD